MTADTRAIADILLRRQGLLFLPAPDSSAGEGGSLRAIFAWGRSKLDDATLRQTARETEAFLLEFAALGYAGTEKLRLAVAALSSEQRRAVRDGALATLSAQLGANQVHRPLFRRFPKGIPRDTHALWVQRVLSHYLQQPDQPCLHCGAEGSTHVLDPCEHVVCDRCFDGDNYSACPICNAKVSRDSPFFGPDIVRELPKEQVRFTRLELGEDLEAATRELFVSSCARTQALNPVDKADLAAIVDHHGAALIPWLPEAIPLKENVALILGRLLAQADGDALAEVLPVAKAQLRTATDVLRAIAVYAGADAALQGETYVQVTQKRYRELPWWETWLENNPKLARQYADQPINVSESKTVKRFPMPKLRRAFRRALLGLLEELDERSLIEDMLRHRSYWVWVGQFLHPGEYAKRFPKVARAFAIVRGKSPSGEKAPAFAGFYAQLEAAADRGDARAMADLLATRPGELGRRFDHLLRVAAVGEAAGDEGSVDHALARFVEAAPKCSTPVLLTLYALLPTRTRRAKRRMFWPKGGVVTAVTTPDERATLPPAVVESALACVEAELLARFAEAPRHRVALVDAGLTDIVAPFNERTASPAAINLPRGSRVRVPEGKTLRLFLHWCETEGGPRTDIDLSVGFYAADWSYLGVCSYYELTCAIEGQAIARSSGDLTSAPFPEGSSEFVDLDWEAARAAGVRHAVMVVNAYSGASFSQLERGFAGLMLRDDVDGHVFDPRTVTLRFDLQGENGIFTPLSLDLEDGTMHWLDVYSKGEMAFNNVASSNRAIQRVCPETIDYFASGVRLDMYRLGLLHAAARSAQVVIRGEDGSLRRFERSEGETAGAFLARLREGSAGVELEPQGLAELLGEEPCLALLLRGDLPTELPEGSQVYALFREALTPKLAAADLLVG